jgi:hypothetical protein
MKVKKDFLSRGYFTVGNGEVRFWEDIWLRNKTCTISFPLQHCTTKTSLCYQCSESKPFEYYILLHFSGYSLEVMSATSASPNECTTKQWKECIF